MIRAPMLLSIAIILCAACVVIGFFGRIFDVRPFICSALMASPFAVSVGMIIAVMIETRRVTS